jgi:hypothetical protein
LLLIRKVSASDGSFGSEQSNVPAPLQRFSMLRSKELHGVINDLRAGTTSALFNAKDAYNHAFGEY